MTEAPAPVPTLGTDFSGLETPSRALQSLGIPFRLLFCAEKEAWLRALIQADTPPEVCIYEDVDNRDVACMPAVQLYVAGPSCQPFSKAGTRHGEADPRGQHMQRCVDYVAAKKPVAFVIENVPIIAAEFTAYFDTLVVQLRVAGYVVKSRILDTLEHGGLPQSHKRL